jgi:sec-independent protein translocase protein TatA
MPAGLDNPVHIILVLLVVVVLFGAKRLPELARSLGTSMREFRGSVTGNEAKQPAALPPGPTPGPTPDAAANTSSDRRGHEQLS